MDSQENTNMFEKDEFDQEITNPKFESTWKLVCLTLGLGGLQGVFAVQFGKGSEYLTSLGISKSLQSLVWLAGPLSGAVLQPYFCLLSDECRSEWGRRRPFIVFGSAAIILSLLGQAWIPDMINATTHQLSLKPGSKTIETLIAATVILFVIILNIAIQPVQGCLRALIVDSCVQEQQDAANAWAGRIISIANVWSYLCGYIDLPSLFPCFGNTQFKVLCTITTFVLIGTITTTCWTTTETPCRTSNLALDHSKGTVHRIVKLLSSFRALSTQLQWVCVVQFFAWMGWFPFLFYIDLFIRDKSLAKASNFTVQGESMSIDIASRTGSLGMLIFASVSLFSSVTIPLLARPVNHAQRHNNQCPSPWHIQLLKSLFDTRIGIRDIWTISHIIFATCMLATLLVSSISGTCILVGIAGISWAVTIWAPFAIISIELSVINDADEGTDDSQSSPQVGMVIGLHNVAIAVPQIVAALVCGLVFALFDGPGSAGGEESVGWVLRIGGISALAAAYSTTRLDCGGKKSYSRLQQV
ncbi:MFS general substrate transporter [Glarea lozoyensis ATCC 20868]|uniref:MFS general substrate transporter n=1 Tax=Glarea lozoyensis (strain ATCC 20868 / MF5171) TaxID=1116229 RepID=S3DCK8_GLAL2|nr:MFS general substrate transporter [Glarea lozoyensis ATCC 20868]EPE24423.1 MFS general substrate transporter [Glarea lozoyensis ATCC 20868]